MTFSHLDHYQKIELPGTHIVESMSGSRLYLLIVICISVTLLYLVYLAYYPYRSNLPRIRRPTPTFMPMILAWTTFFDDYSFMTPDLNQLRCPVQNCVLTRNRTLAKNADVILFHWRDLKIEDIPPDKPKKQKWVLMNFESPLHNSLNVLAQIVSRIDWTATYRLDSEFYAPYGRFRSRESSDPPVEDLSQSDFEKKLPIAWMVSNCNSHSKREELVKHLIDNIRVDVYGKCDSMYGQKNEAVHIPKDRPHAYSFLAKRYKFYLSFENSICRHYITEKAFHPLETGMVPIVLGDADYDQVLPPGSFINARNFSSPKLLAQYLNEVSTNFSLYNQYMEWRKDFVMDSVPLNRFFCDLCAKLQSSIMPSIMPSTNRNLMELWNPTASCKQF